MDDNGQEQAATLAEVTTLLNQLITDTNTMISSNSSDTTGLTSLANFQTVKGDVRQVENVLTAFIQLSQYGA